MPLSMHNAKHQQRARIIIISLLLVCRLAPKVHLYRADEVLHSVRLSRACNLLKIGMP